MDGAPKRRGRILIAGHLLERYLGLPPDVRVVRVGERPSFGAEPILEIMVEGDCLPAGGLNDPTPDLAIAAEVRNDEITTTLTLAARA